jgi:hypothetical protein
MLKRGRPITDETKRAKPNDIIECSICKGKYTRANRSKHNKIRQHQQALRYEEIIKNTLHQQLPKKNDLSSRIESAYYDWNGEKIYMNKAKFDYYNIVSMSKNGYPLYFKTQSDRKRTMRDFEEIGSDEENEETNSESYETNKEENSLSIESDSDDDDSTIIVPYWFIKKLDDPNILREELKKMLLIYNNLAIKQGSKLVKPIKLKKK